MQLFFNIYFEPDKDEVLRRIDEENGPAFICVSDGNIITMVHRDAEYRKIVQSSLLSIVDSSMATLCERRNVGDYLACADFFILSSVYEGLPLTLLEAMSIVMVRMAFSPRALTQKVCMIP